MKPREKEFCHYTAVVGDPERAAALAGYKHPSSAWQELIIRREIVDEIGRRAEAMQRIYRATALSGLYRLAVGDISDAMTLLYKDSVTKEDLAELDLSCVAEIKRTKDKSMEIKFFDRIKAMSMLNDLLGADADAGATGGLIEAMRLSAEALGHMSATGDTIDEP